MQLITLGVSSLYVHVKGIVAVKRKYARIGEKAGAVDSIQYQVGSELFVGVGLGHRYGSLE